MSCKDKIVVIVGDFTFPSIDCGAKGWDEEVFVKYVQEYFLRQFVDHPTRVGAKLKLLLGNKTEQVTGLLVRVAHCYQNGKNLAG